LSIFFIFEIEIDFLLLRNSLAFLKGFDYCEKTLVSSFDGCGLLKGEGLLVLSENPSAKDNSVFLVAFDRPLIP
jgi:hypothetical protein